MICQKALVVCLSVLLTSPYQPASSQTQDEICRNCPLICRNCPLIRNIYQCDFKDLEPRTEINIECLKDNDVYIDNANDIRISGRICSNVRFMHSRVELRGSSSLNCPIKLEFMQDTKLDSLPDGAQNITISYSRIDDLTSKTLIDADISGATIQVVNIRSSTLKSLIVRDSTISKLNHIDLTPGCNVNVYSSNMYTTENNPISYNGGRLMLEDSHIISKVTTVTLKPDEKPVVSGSQVNPSEPLRVSSEPSRGLEVAVGILSVAVAVLILVQFATFLRSYRKKNFQRVCLHSENCDCFANASRG
ncbi:unnamed protein product [Meganyctiphanes norvegica]|uniref:Uncharacterized protein n=1 Tax=Meganyctiphanes norvegica TaxID=48144 RepID=A0AAV2QCI1_MEGNR